jgi:HSP20 family protein
MTMSYPVREHSSPAVRRDPFAALEAMQERFNRLIGDAFTGYRGRTPFWHPDIELSGTDDGWLVEVRLPGVAPDEVVVDVTDRELNIRARHEEDGGDGPGPGSEHAQQTQQQSKFARRLADFSYRLTVPADVDTEAIDATMDHGLLQIRLPRSTADRSRRITVDRPAATIEGSSQETGEETPA